MSSRFIQRFSYIFIWIFAFLLSSQLGKHFFFPFSYLSGIRIDYLAPTIYLTDILSLPILAYSIVQSFKRLNLTIEWIGKNRYFVIIFALLVVVNLFTSLSKPLWFYSVIRILQWASIFYFFNMQTHNKKIYSTVLLGLLVGGVVQLTLTLFQLAGRGSLQGLWYYLGERSFTIFTPSIAKAYVMGHEFLRPYGTFSHPNSLAGFYLLLYFFVLTQQKVTTIFFKTLSLTLFSFLILISFSRTAIAVYVIINVLYFLKNKLTCRICLLAKLATATILIFFALNISGDLNSFQKRNDFAQKSISIIRNKPFSGTGVGSYLIAQHTFPQKFSTFFEQPVHNIFLLAVAQLGIPLSVLIVTMIIRIIIVTIKKNSFLLPLLVVVLTGFMDHYWLTLQQNVLLTAVVFGMISSYEAKTT